MKTLRYKRLVLGIVTGLALLVGLIGLSVRQFGSVRNMLAFLNGINFAVQPALVDAGKGREGEERKVSANVSNLGFKPLRVVGLRTSCRCISTESPPMMIAPGTTRRFVFTVRLSRSNGRFEQKVLFMFDNGGRLATASVVIAATVERVRGASSVVKTVAPN